MNWKIFNTTNQLEEIISLSFSKPVVIYKHSTRCSLSSMIKSRLEKSVPPQEIDFYFLDIIQYRSLSNQIAHQFGVTHESPQVLLISQGNCTFHESHYAIRMEDLQQQMAQ